MKTSSYWRDKCRPIIAQVLKETAGLGEQMIRKALHDAYPFNERKYHPYKIWLDEIALQRGKRKPTQRALGRKKKAKPVDSNQMNLL